MNPDEIREIKKRQRYYNSYLDQLTEGKISKKFKPTSIDLVQEFYENKIVIEDFHNDLKKIEENNSDQEAEPFNLEKEREEGLFDKSGNLLLPKDRAEVTDP